MNARWTRRWWLKQILDASLGFAVTLVLFTLLELGLRACSAPLTSGSGGLSRGFDPAARYLVPDPEVPGGWRTQMMQESDQERRFPPKGERLRVLLFGGSNTAGLPGERLAQKLNEGRAKPLYEVLNLGREGYGSGRVKLLVEQALQCLEPDLLFIYSGHNEFVERSFRLDLEQHWGGSLRQLAGWLGQHSRLVQSVERALRSLRTAAHNRPEAWTWEYGKFQGISYAETLEQLEGYRENLSAMCRAAAAKAVPVALCTVVPNYFDAPFESSFPPELAEAERLRFREHRGLALAKLPAFLAPLLPERAQDHVFGYEWGAVDLSRPDVTLPGCRPPSGPFVGQRSGRTTPAAWSPKITALFAALERLHARNLDAAEQAGLGLAESELVAALELCPDHPRALFELGLVRYLLGRPAELVAANLRSAARYDRAPRKASDATNDIVRAVGRARPEVILLDIEAEFARHMRLGLPGWEWFDDHCHLNYGAKLVLLDYAASELRARLPQR